MALQFTDTKNIYEPALTQVCKRVTDGVRRPAEMRRYLLIRKRAVLLEQPQDDSHTAHQASRAVTRVILATVVALSRCCAVHCDTRDRLSGRAIRVFG